MPGATACVLAMSQSVFVFVTSNNKLLLPSLFPDDFCSYGGLVDVLEVLGGGPGVRRKNTIGCLPSSQVKNGETLFVSAAAGAVGRCAPDHVLASTTTSRVFCQSRWTDCQERVPVHRHWQLPHTKVLDPAFVSPAPRFTCRAAQPLTPSQGATRFELWALTLRSITRRSQRDRRRRKISKPDSKSTRLTASTCAFGRLGCIDGMRMLNWPSSCVRAHTCHWYFENVGGFHFEAAFNSLRKNGRIAVCGR
jgi:hypothetical protein